MIVDSKDLISIDNLIKLIKRGRFELSGEETLIFADCFRWLGGMAVTIREDAAKPTIVVKEKKDKIKNA